MKIHDDSFTLYNFETGANVPSQAQRECDPAAISQAEGIGHGVLAREKKYRPAKARDRQAQIWTLIHLPAP